jgi:hypothetical protein
MERHRESVRVFVAMIDPSMGYIGDSFHSKDGRYVRYYCGGQFCYHRHADGSGPSGSSIAVSAGALRYAFTRYN